MPLRVTADGLADADELEKLTKRTDGVQGAGCHHSSPTAPAGGAVYARSASERRLCRCNWMCALGDILPVAFFYPSRRPKAGNGPGKAEQFAKKRSNIHSRSKLGAIREQLVEQLASGSKWEQVGAIL